MNWELDHVFFATPDLAGVERALSDVGLRFSRHVVHEGQGTANACSVFQNAFFEVLGIHDVDELKSELVHPLALYERIHWADTGACPLGSLPIRSQQRVQSRNEYQGNRNCSA